MLIKKTSSILCCLLLIMIVFQFNPQPTNAKFIIDRQQDNILNGSKRDDKIFGLDGADKIFASQGSDFVYGNRGNDILYGGKGHDTLYGGKGHDKLFGNKDDDTLAGQLGNDILIGGAGNDAYYYRLNDGKDVIKADKSGTDVLYLRNISPSQIQTNISGNTLKINVPQGQIIIENFSRIEHYYCGQAKIDIGDSKKIYNNQYLNKLRTSNYQETETLTQKLKTIANRNLVLKLLHMAKTDKMNLARRNALRVIGNLGQNKTKTSQLIKQQLKDQIKNTLKKILENERNTKVLLEAVWIADSIYYPYLKIQNQLKRISLTKNFTSQLRFRAIKAYTRLLNKKNNLEKQDINFLTNDALLFPDFWVRSQSAHALTLYKSKINPSHYKSIIDNLNYSYHKENKFTSKIYLAKAIDKYSNSNLTSKLKNNFIKNNLPNKLTTGNITIQSGLSENKLHKIMQLLNNCKQSFFALTNYQFTTPVPNDPNENIELFLFKTKKAYKTYMNSFVGYGANFGGLYLEDKGRLYTYDRTPKQSKYTMEELIKHEYAHRLQARYIFPGTWQDRNYHNQPKGWVDEGIAELFAGIKFSHTGNYKLPLRKNKTNYIINKREHLIELLKQEKGYNKSGVFNYDGAWSFMLFMFKYHKHDILNILKQFRNKTYNLNDLTSYTNFYSIKTLEEKWHQRLDKWKKQIQ